METGRASWTARWVASQRARLHDQRPVRGDSAAELRLYEDLAIPLLSIRLARPTGMAARTAFFDDQVLQAIERRVTQVVLVGAGYDGRALRFSDTPVRWVEVDHPATQADKRQRLARVGARIDQITFVAVDLLAGDLDAELQAAGHGPTQPTLWICEGLFPYLPAPVIDRLCRLLRDRSSPGSALACNVLANDSPTAITRITRKAVDAVLRAAGERRLTEFSSNGIRRFLTDAGWQVDHQESTRPGRFDRDYLLNIQAIP